MHFFLSKNSLYRPRCKTHSGWKN